MAASTPTPNAEAPDQELLGRARGYPRGAHYFSWMTDESVRVGTFSGMDLIDAHNVLSRPANCWQYGHGALDADFAYDHGGTSNAIEDYLAHQRVMGLLIVHEGRILFERYQYERRPEHRFLSHSMSKSLVGLAVGLAHKQGLIGSLDDPLSRYVAALAGTGYGNISTRQLLRMSSGIRFMEKYNGKDDFAHFMHVMHSDGEVAAGSPL